MNNEIKKIPNNLELALMNFHNVHERIKFARLSKKFSQQKLANSMYNIGFGRISRAAIAQWESGATKNISGSHLLNFARVVGADPEIIIFGKFL